MESREKFLRNTTAFAVSMRALAIIVG
jgi:hypothetical protein